jgi:isopenicillin-N epimerase
MLDRPRPLAESPAMMREHPDFGHDLHDLWLLEPEIAYLNHAGFGAAPRIVLAAADHWRRRMEAEPVRFMEEELLPALDKTRARLAGFLGAEADGLAFVDNATTGMNAVLQSLALAPGDEIVAADHAYPAIRHTLDVVTARAGAVLTLAEMPFPVSDPADIVAAYESALTPKTRLVVTDHIASHSAVRMPLEAIIALAADRGIPVAVDGAHAPGNIALDLGALAAIGGEKRKGEGGLAWYVGNCHKWLCAPKSAGFLWTAPGRRAATHPTVVGNLYFDGYAEAFSWPGTRDFSPWLAVADAVDFHRDFGSDAIRAYTHGLAQEAAAMLAARWAMPRGTAPELATAMTTIALPLDAEPTVDAGRQISRVLRHEHGVEVVVVPVAGRLWVRISAYLYNAMADYDRLAAAVLKLKG